MFERYTEMARRTIFFARYEASSYGSAKIETEHLLLGILREDERLAHTLFDEPDAGEAIRKETETQITRGKPISTSTEMPLSEESKRILNFAADSADKLGHRRVENDHWVLGILREQGCLAARILESHRVQDERIRENLANYYPGPTSNASDMQRSLTAASSRAELGAILDRLVEAWDAEDVARVVNLFADGGQFWDNEGQQWSGVDLRKGLESHFTAHRTELNRGIVEQTLSAAPDVTVVTVRWSSTKTDFQQMVAVLRENGPDWQIVSAHLAFIETP
jgi:ketosteroid isomerase-like protein